MLYDDTLLLRFDSTTASAFGYFRCPSCATETYDSSLYHRPACQHAGPLEFWLGEKAIARILAGSDHVNPVSEDHLRSQLPAQVAASDLVRHLPPVAGETPAATQALPTLMAKAASPTSVAAASHSQVNAPLPALNPLHGVVDDDLHWVPRLGAVPGFVGV
jgi:hypothetical protein